MNNYNGDCVGEDDAVSDDDDYEFELMMAALDHHNS